MSSHFALCEQGDVFADGVAIKRASASLCSALGGAMAFLDFKLEYTRVSSIWSLKGGALCLRNTVRECSKGQPRCLSVWLDLTNRLVVKSQGCSQITCAATAVEDCAGAHSAALLCKKGRVTQERAVVTRWAGSLMLRGASAGAECFRLCRDLLDGILLVRAHASRHHGFCAPWHLAASFPFLLDTFICRA